MSVDLHPNVDSFIELGVLVVGVVVWLIRLEGKIKNNSDKIEAVETNHTREIDKLEIRQEALENKIFDKLSVIEKSLAKIEGRLSIEHVKGE